MLIGIGAGDYPHSSVRMNAKGLMKSERLSCSRDRSAHHCQVSWAVSCSFREMALPLRPEISTSRRVEVVLYPSWGGLP